MNALRIGLSVGLLALAAMPAAAQNAVQLPTYSSFRTGTTVSVPDRGRVYTGGINRAADGRNEFGTPLLPLRNRSIGSQRSASSVWTSVYIHDFEAMDELLLGQAGVSSYRSAARPLPGASPVAVAGVRPVPRSPIESRDMQRSPAPRPATSPMSKSVAQLKAERAGQQQARVAEAERLFQRGKDSQLEGKLNVARIYFQQALRRAQGPLKDKIAGQLELLSSTAVAQR